ncbi:hypothetical protein HDU86_000146 [Geranomyces michiganensis]|nr:hypothetical protein HDU86_000146 [Geranomyces michiganensis]
MSAAAAAVAKDADEQSTPLEDSLPSSLASPSPPPPPPADPTHFDAIVLGTGLTNSITAAALVRAGKSVLHIDRNEFYAEHLASFDLVTFLRILGQAATESDNPFYGCYDELEVTVNAEQPSADSNEPSVPTTSADPALTGNTDQAPPLSSTPSFAGLEASITAYTADYPSTTTLFGPLTTPPQRLALLTLLRASRQYNLELSPRILYSRGALVELLANSGVGRYLEFRPLDGIHLLWEGRAEQVPGSKEDVFGNKSVSLVDKRRLMKFLTFALSFEESPEVFEEYKSKPYAEFLAAQKLSPRLIAFILNATALIVEQRTLSTLTTEQGLLLTQRHLRSLGRWGKTAFLVALYGAGSELSQAFCRLCAVYGGIYILNFPVAEISATDAGGVSVTAKDGTTYTADKLVMSPAYVPFLAPELRPTLTRESMYRCLAITDRDVHGADQPGLTVTAFPPGAIGNTQGVTAIQQSWDVSACPKTQAVIHLSASGLGSSQQDVRRALDALVKQSSATVLFCMTYRRCTLHLPSRQGDGTDMKGEVDDNDDGDVWWTAGGRIVVTRDEGGSGLDLEACADAAENVFSRLAEGQEFLPALADPAQDEE